MLPSSYATTHTLTSSPNPPLTSLNYDSNLSTASSTPIKNDTGYEYPTSVDPSLQNHASSTLQDGSRQLDQKPLADNNFHLRGGAPYYA